MRMAALVWVGLCTGSMAGCRPVQPTEAREVVPEIKLEEVRFRLYRGESLRLSGESRVLTLRRDTRDLAARDLAARIAGEGRPPFVVTAPEGAGNVGSRTFAVRGGVTLARGDDVAHTEAAAYAPGGTGKGLVTGHDPVVVDGPGYRLTGTGFTLDPATGILDMGGGVRLVTGLGENR
jgi:lipopolysaccharide export system protein LptC